MKPRHGFACLFLLACANIHASARAGVIVPHGETPPLPNPITVTGGQQLHVDLMLAYPLPENSSVRSTLFLLGGKLALVAGTQTQPVATKSEGRSGFRAPLVLDLPPTARKGSRFLLKVETEPANPGADTQLLAEREVVVAESEPGDEIRGILNGRPVQVAGKSPKLRELLETLQIPVSLSATSATNLVLLGVEPVNPPAGFGTRPNVAVQFRDSAGEALLITAKKSGDAWLIEAHLPRSLGLSPLGGGPRVLVEIFRLIDKLEVQK